VPTGSLQAAGNTQGARKFMLNNIISRNNNTITVELSHHGCYGFNVQARFANIEEPICFVNVAVVGSDFIVMKFGVNPQVTMKEAQAAGDEIDSVLEQEAFKLGLKRLLLVHPNQNTAELVREYTLQPHLLSAVPCNTKPCYLN
jgi:hypothetical protein